jgi:hypothetical protein
MDPGCGTSSGACHRDIGHLLIERPRRRKGVSGEKVSGERKGVRTFLGPLRNQLFERSEGQYLGCPSAYRQVYPKTYRRDQGV